MDISDILFIIDGTLEVERTDDGLYEAVLYDNVHEVCRIRFGEDDTRRRAVPPLKEARAVGASLWSACEELAKLIAGSYLSYEFSIMWDTYTTTIHVPSTFVTGIPTITERRKEPEHDKTPPSAA